MEFERHHFEHKTLAQMQNREDSGISSLGSIPNSRDPSFLGSNGLAETSMDMDNGDTDGPLRMHHFHQTSLSGWPDESDNGSADGGSSLKIMASIGVNDGSLSPVSVKQVIKQGQQLERKSATLMKPGRSVVLGEVTIGNINEIQIKVKTLTGKECKIIVDKADTVDHLKEMVEERFSVAKAQQKLLFRQKQLQGGKLATYGIVEGSEIHLVFNLRGG